MARPNGHDDDPRVTDLRRYKQEREKAAKTKPPAAKAPKAAGGSFLGSNPRAGLILVAVIVVLALVYVAPLFL